MAKLAKIIITLLFLIGIVTILYFSYDKFYQTKNNEEIIYHNLYLKALDIETNEYKEVEYSIYLDNENTIYITGKTYKEGRNKIEIPSNRSFILITKIEDEYYNTFINNTVNMSSNKELTIYLNKYGNLSILANRLSNSGKFIDVNINKRGYIPNVGLCIRWSSNLLYVDVLNLTKTNIPKRLTGYVDKCYKDISFINNSSNIIFKYKIFKTLDSSDNIKVYLIDYDIKEFSLFDEEKYVNEDKYEKDIGINDIEYIIN